MSVGEEREAPEVTFVGGRAIEQKESLDSNLEPDARDEAKEAVEKAIREAGESAASESKSERGKDPYKPPGTKKTEDEVAPKGEKETPERGPDGKFLPKDGKPKTEEKPDAEPEFEFDPSSANVKALLKNREKLANQKREAKSEIDAARQQYQQEVENFRREQEEFRQAQAQLQRQYQAFQALKSDPARAVREVGYDPEQFILDLAQEGTPEGQARRRQKEIDSQLAEIRNWREEQQRAQIEWQRQQQQQAVVAHRQKAVKDFTELGLNAEKYPHVAAFYKGHERALVARGDITAQEYRQLSGGKEGSYEDILDYIEDQLAERFNSMYTVKSNKKSDQKVELDQKPKSKGKSLSPDASGERRALKAKELVDLDGDERLNAAKQAVDVALANS